MRGSLVLGGGDEFRQPCERADRALLEAIGGPRIRVAIVPTAQADGGSNPVRAGNHGVRYFTGLGADATNVLITDRASAADPALIDQLRSADLIYMAGGNPGYLLRTLRDTPAEAAMRAAWQAGTTIAGSSAGAMVLCAAQIGRYSGSHEPWIAGLGFVPDALAAVHHEHASDSVGFDLLATLPDGYSVIGIDACNNAVWRPDGSWQMLGDGSVHVYRPGAQRSEQYTHGETWSL